MYQYPFKYQYGGLLFDIHTELTFYHLRYETHFTEQIYHLNFFCKLLIVTIFKLSVNLRPQRGYIFINALLKIITGRKSVWLDRLYVLDDWTIFVLVSKLKIA